MASAPHLSIDATPPSITSATTATGADTYGPGSSIDVTLNFGENATSAAGLDVTLNNGAHVSIAPFTNVASASGTYVVGATGSGEDTSALDVASISGSVDDQVSPANTNSSLSVPGGSNISDTTTIEVDTTAPLITSATTATGADTYGPGSNIDVTLNFGENATSAAGLDVTLNNGAHVSIAPFTNVASASGTYTVGATGSGEDTTALDVSSISGSVDDQATNPNTNSSLSVPGGNNISDSITIAVDTTAPSVVSITPNKLLYTDSDVGLGTVTVTVVFDESMDSSGGINDPTLGLTAPIPSGLSFVSGVWSTTSVLNDTITYTFDLSDANETSTGVDLSVSGGKDVAGNTLITGSSVDAFSIDTQNPSVVSITPSATLLADANVGSSAFFVSVVFDETMDATGPNDPTIDIHNPPQTGLSFASGAWSTTSVTDDTYTATYDFADNNETVYNIDIDVSGAKDLAGNVQTAGNSVDVLTIDTQNPTVTIHQPANSGNTKMANPLIVETDENANCTYNLDSTGATPIANTGGLYHTDNFTGLTAASHTVDINCLDAAGNSGTASATWTKLSPGFTVLYGTNGQGSNIGELYTIDPETGSITSDIGSTGTCLTGLAEDPTTNILYGVSTWTCPTNSQPGTSTDLFRVNKDTGAATFITALSGDLLSNCEALGDIDFDAAGNLYGVDCSGYYYSVNKATGVTTELTQPEAGSTYGNGLAYNSATNEMYWLPGGDSTGGAPNGNMDIIATVTGVLNSTVNLVNGSGNHIALGAAKIDDSGMLFAVRYGNNPSPHDFVVIDKASGIIAPIGTTPNNADMNKMSAIAFYMDTLAPTVVSLSPADNATGVSTAANLVMNFNENVQDIPIANVVIYKSSDNSVVETIPISDPRVTFSGTTVTINPNTVLQNGIGYYVQIDATAIKDMVGNHYAGISDTTTWNFTTVSLSGGGGSSGPGFTPYTPPAKPQTGINLVLQDPQPAAPLPPEVKIGTLVKLANSSVVYFIDQDNRRHAFPNSTVFASYYPDYSGVQTVSSVMLASIPLGSNVTMRPGTYLVKIQSDPKVYAVEPYGVLRWISTEQIATSLYGADWSKRIVDVDPTFFINYQTGSDLTTSIHPTGSVISYQGDNKAYYIDNGSKNWINADVFAVDKFQSKFLIANLPASITYATGTDYPALGMESVMTLR